MKNATNILVLTVTLAACSKDPYTKALDEFVTGCAQSGAPEELCECSFEKAAEQIGKQEIVRAYNTNSMPSGMAEISMEAMQACAQE